MRIEPLWQYSTIHNSPCKVIDEQTLWGQVLCFVWLPNQNKVVRVPRSALRSLSADLQPEIEAGRITYVAAAAKVAELLESSSGQSPGHASEGPVLLAPMESNVIPLPHQLHALSRAISGDRLRYLLADEVGLGKTIEAGLIMRELKLRGLVRRILVVSPKGIATQWVEEMQTHFNEKFHLVLGEDISAMQRLASGEGQRTTAWSMFDQVIVSLDSVKPMDKRRGWTPERVAEYNRGRFEDLITANWDLVVFDEAHRLGGSTDQVARYKLGKALSEAVPYVLLLSATPHQGKTDAFHRLMNLLDDDAFPDIDSVSRERVAPYVIRTEKRKAIDADGKPLFKPRHTHLAPVAWENRHHLQQLLYEAVTDYVREGYNKALREQKRHIGFLMILMQRLVVSSTKAIRSALERRKAILEEDKQKTDSRLASLTATLEEDIDDEELYDLDGQELLDELLKSHVAAVENELDHVQTLLEAALQCEQTGPDAKAETLIEWMYKLQIDENEADLKVLIFTEFVATQEMLAAFLQARGIPVVTLNGSMTIEERKAAQDSFSTTHRIMISTDAGGEGLNLQFAHVVINYDIPWNPMRLEQRIGRVDRIGQTKIVRALNFILESSVEYRVLEVLEHKLSIILQEFGIDKTGDVLDSSQAGEAFEAMYINAIMNPAQSEKIASKALDQLKTDIRQIRQYNPVFGFSSTPRIEYSTAIKNHPLPYWLEHMVKGYLKSSNGKVVQNRSTWDITWPDGQVQKRCVFSSKETYQHSEVTLLNLENPKIQNLLRSLPECIEPQLLPNAVIPGLPKGITGLWGLFEIRLRIGLNEKAQFLRIPTLRKAYFNVFLSEEGKVFIPTARHIWELLLATEPRILSYLDQDQSIAARQQLLNAVEQEGESSYDLLRQSHRALLTREKERGHTAYSARRKAIERIGLPEVRGFRLARLDEEHRKWQGEMQSAQQILPEIRPLLMLHIVEDTL